MTKLILSLFLVLFLTSCGGQTPEDELRVAGYQPVGRVYIGDLAPGQSKTIQVYIDYLYCATCHKEAK